MNKDDHLIWESFKNRLPSAGPDDALKNTGPGENEEDTPYASGQVGGRDEEYGTGEVKLLLLRDEKFDCYLNGTVQSVRFFRGTIFNCEPYDGEFYNCESDEYGTIAITPDAHLKILDAPAGSTNTEDEDAEGRPGMQTYIYLDLYTGKTSVIPSREFQDAIDGLEKVRGKMTVYRGEEYMVLVVPAGTTVTEDAESADEKKERVQRGWQINKDRWAKWKKENPEAAAKNAARKAGKSENAEEQNRIVGNDVIQNDRVIGEFLGDSYSSKLTLNGKDMFMPGAPYAQTVNQGTHMGLWYKNKRHKLVVRDASKWKEFLSDIVATGDDKYWDGKKMHQHDHMGDKIAADNAYWSKRIAAGADQTPAENAENEPHGYPQGMTAIQNLVLNTLKKIGFELTKISHEDKERDKYPTVFMVRKQGPIGTYNVVDIDGMGYINGEPYKKYLANLKDEYGSEDAEGRSRAQQAAIAISLQKAGKKPS
jgi:hypothetical protein